MYTAVAMLIFVLFCMIPAIGSWKDKKNCSHYVPGSDPSTQPKTYCSPTAFKWNCSIAIPETTWHLLQGAISLGRCCQPVYGWNGTFTICESNGKSDQLTACGDGFHNLNSPFSSAEYVEVSEHADWVCHKQNPLSDSDIPHVMWKQQEFIIRKGQSITLLAEVHSSTELVRVAILDENVQFPLFKPKSEIFPHYHHRFAVHFTFSNVTTSDSGRYYFVATNKLASGWSGITLLTVLKGTEGTTSGSPRIRSCMILIICMACVIFLH
ncbi:uncharacterized protein LOC110460183 isoform X2 [Mizuhopecten yessoensis]|uniref:uncharacterized protein LOC110460183 isoform X2 n=1 Tax=Mizuhopecten yessoensis TaxID=6573 RepID=UPI000B457C51|nr:uncharacterized protein LOC110460183 isoform X2 [Mizuhopecten yessoensis]